MSMKARNAVRLLVTGGAGYAGSVCAARLIEAGHEVVVVDDLSTGHADAVPAGCRLVTGDIAEVADSLLAEGFDGVLHFAAKSLVSESMTEPAKYWHGNVVTSVRLLDAMVKHGTPRLVFSSTAATYGEPTEVPIKETAQTRPTNTYGATKLAIDYAITSYATTHGLAAVSLRYFNVAGAYGRFGERHATETHLIPIVLQVALGQRDAVGMRWGWRVHRVVLDGSGADHNPQFFGLLVGPRGNSLKKMERESGAKISIRGKGSVKEGKARPDQYADDAEEDLHCLVLAETEEKVAACVKMINRVIETVRSLVFDYRFCY